MKPNFIILLCIVFLLTVIVKAKSPVFLNSDDPFSEVKLKNKIIPLTNSVYQLLDYYESKGISGFLPQVKPYTKITILRLLKKVLENHTLSEREQKVAERYLSDFMNESNGLILYHKTLLRNNFGLLGVSPESSIRSGFGDNATWSVQNPLKPYMSVDIGKNIMFHTSIGASIEKLSPDIFYESYTKDKKVIFPYETTGYAWLPYQFNYETSFTHAQVSTAQLYDSNLSNKITFGAFHQSELTGSWLDGSIQISYNNQRRAWGHDNQNLVLSATARSFPAVEFKLEPSEWFRYSFITGSLYSGANQREGYKKSVYGYDLGEVQKNFTYHFIEFTPVRWMQLTAGTGNIWSKRHEMIYMLPMPHSLFSQEDLADQDNLFINLSIAMQIPKLGKTWFDVFIDEFTFNTPGSLLIMPHNRYAWQWGLKSAFLSALIPSTLSTIKYSRVTPFVYTHYPETDFNLFSTRPLDMTYTHDGFNLGFYLPPNSGELSFQLENMALTDLVLSIDNRLIIHGTNDLAITDPYRIYGDIYRYQLGKELNKYPLLDFTKDGIYDWTLSTEVKFDWRIRMLKNPKYFRLTGGFGYAKTWWEQNESEVTVPETKKFWTANIGIVVDM